ncbi:MAG: hypothetical protein WCK51_12630 [Armatimonadota bacterium]
MEHIEQTKEINQIAVAGKVFGSINEHAFNGTVTGTANRATGHVRNIYHGIDPAIGAELSRIVLGLTIVCSDMAIEVGTARNLNSIAPMQSMRRLATYRLPNHTMQCLQTVIWPVQNIAVVTMEYSGTLPVVSGEGPPIPDVICDFQQTGPQTIRQYGQTHASFGAEALPLSVEIDYWINVHRIAWSKSEKQCLANEKNSSKYDATRRTITYDTHVRMLEAS